MHSHKTKLALECYHVHGTSRNNNNKKYNDQTPKLIYSTNPFQKAYLINKRKKTKKKTLYLSIFQALNVSDDIFLC